MTEHILCVLAINVIKNMHGLRIYYIMYDVQQGPTTGKPKTLYEHLEYCIIYKCCMFLGFQC